MKLVFLLLFLPFFAEASVSFNEVAWMGTTTSANDEWIELYNNGEEINLDGWIIKSDKLNIPLSGTISKYYLLERTNDSTVPDVVADKIYTGALNNSGMQLTLTNKDGNTVDQLDFSSGWPAGDNITKETMAKVSGVWQTTKATPKADNTGAKIEEVTKTEVSIPHISGIVFSEILPYSSSGDTTGEYIKLYNKNQEETDISYLLIKDTVGKITNYIIPQGTKMAPNSSLTLTRTQTKITLNNIGDKLLLLEPGGNTLDQVEYKDAKKGVPYIFNGTWKWKEVKEDTIIPEKEKLVTSLIEPENSFNNVLAIGIISSIIILISILFIRNKKHVRT